MHTSRIRSGPRPRSQRASLFTSNTAVRQSLVSAVRTAVRQSLVSAVRRGEELASKDNEIGQLRKTLKKRETELLKQYMTSRPLVEKVDLTTDDEPASKRQRTGTENCPKKSIAILLFETSQKLVKVKEEQVEMRAELREDLEDKQEDVDNQVLYTNFLQSKIDELAAMAEAAGADKAKVAEIKQRTYRSS